jgi:hypothetical protein
MNSRTTVSLSVPVAMLRNRPQSLTDLETEQATGQPRNGDAAFADYLINFSVAYRIAPDDARAPAPFNLD